MIRRIRVLRTGLVYSEEAPDELAAGMAAVRLMRKHPTAKILIEPDEREPNYSYTARQILDRKRRHAE